MDLNDAERETLVQGLGQWGGPASLTSAWARALGFKSERKFSKEAKRLRKSLTRRQPLTPADWLKVIRATELVFVSDSVGAG